MKKKILIYFQHYPFLFSPKEKLRKFSELIYKDSAGRFCTRPYQAAMLLRGTNNVNDDNMMEMLDHNTYERSLDDALKAIDFKSPDCLAGMN